MIPMPSSRKFAGFWRTHPSLEDRIEKVQEEISYLPAKDEYILNGSQFERAKARLIEIDNGLLLSGSSSGSGAAKRPTLKRRTNRDSQDEGEEPTLEKDRPTLKRPEEG